MVLVGLSLDLRRLLLVLLHPLLGLLVQVEAQAQAPFLAHKLFHPQSPSHIYQLGSYSYPLAEELLLVLPVLLGLLHLELLHPELGLLGLLHLEPRHLD